MVYKTVGSETSYEGRDGKDTQVASYFRKTAGVGADVMSCGR